MTNTGADQIAFNLARTLRQSSNVLKETAVSDPYGQKRIDGSFGSSLIGIAGIVMVAMFSLILWLRKKIIIENRICDKINCNMYYIAYKVD